MGLEITSSEIILAKIKPGGKVIKYSVKLPQGVFINGEIKDDYNFKNSLNKLRSSASLINKKIDVIVSALAERVYVKRVIIATSVFLKDNIQDFQNALSEDLSDKYYVFKEIKNSHQHKKEFLFAWTEKKLVDDLKKCLQETNFNVVDFEFPPISFSRFMKFKKPKVVFSFANEGLTLLKFDKNYLSDFKFYSLPEIQKEIGGKHMEKGMVDRFIKEKLNLFNFSDFEVSQIGSNSAVFGAALGLARFSSKKGISEKLIKISFFAALFIFSLFMVFDLILISRSVFLNKLIKKNSSLPAIKNSEELSRLIPLAEEAGNDSYVKILDAIYDADNSQITLESISIDKDRNVFVSGKAINETAAVNFKTRIADGGIFKDVVLPLSELKKSESGGILFNISFSFFKNSR